MRTSVITNHPNHPGFTTTTHHHSTGISVPASTTAPTRQPPPPPASPSPRPELTVGACRVSGARRREPRAGAGAVGVHGGGGGRRGWTARESRRGARVRVQLVRAVQRTGGGRDGRVSGLHRTALGRWTGQVRACVYWNTGRVRLNTTDGIWTRAGHRSRCKMRDRLDYPYESMVKQCHVILTS